MARLHEKLFLGDLKLKLDSSEFVVNNHIVKWVDIIGNVVYLSEREKTTTFHLDDLTGIIACVQFNCSRSDYDALPLNNDTTLDEDLFAEGRGSKGTPKSLLSDLAPQLSPLKLGDLINIRGYLNIFNAKPQIICKNIRQISDPNEIWFRVKEIETFQNYRSSESFIETQTNSV